MGLSLRLDAQTSWPVHTAPDQAVGSAEIPAGSIRSFSALVSLVAASVVLGTAGALWTESMLPIALFACVSCLGACRLTQPRRVASGSVEHSRYVADKLCLQTLPVWARQIEFASSHSNEEVARLARSFAGLASRLEHATGAELFAQGGRADLMPHLQATKSDLQSLLNVLAALQDSRQSIVRDVGAEARVLQANAEDIRQIALHARIVALNATIEAVRAGEQGKAFAVVVTHMRDLAARMAQASEQFSQQTQHLNQVVQSAFQENTQADSRKTSVAWAQELTATIATRFEETTGGLNRSLAAMRAEREEVRAEISSILVSLQFGDRTSQILSHVAGNIQHMQHEMESGGWAHVGEEEWSSRMSAKYSTAEEVQIQARGAAAAVSSNTGITYF